MMPEQIEAETDTEKTENNIVKQNRDFERHKIYTPRNLDIQYGHDKTNKNKEKYGHVNNYNNYNSENKFRFKNSLVITPFYEIEFNASGGIKYIKNHEGCVFFTDESIFITTNNIQKIPVLMKRGINKQSIQKKLIIEEKYNYEEKYEIHKNIILYFEENRIDFQILFNKSESVPAQNNKDITTEFSLNLSVPGASGADDTVTYKKYSDKSDALEYISIKCGKRNDDCMTLYPDKKLRTEYKNKSLGFIASNLLQPQKNYINLKIYLENYRIT
ncbi:MAG: hypothetical protein FWF92_09610 [Oscillospiraceae bacterium]|nr:hypothetical protein [Oscillospiraceae bacterium]